MTQEYHSITQYEEKGIQADIEKSRCHCQYVCDQSGPTVREGVGKTKRKRGVVDDSGSTTEEGKENVRLGAGISKKQKT